MPSSPSSDSLRVRAALPYASALPEQFQALTSAEPTGCWHQDDDLYRTTASRRKIKLPTKLNTNTSWSAPHSCSSRACYRHALRLLIQGRTERASPAAARSEAAEQVAHGGAYRASRPRGAARLAPPLRLSRQRRPGSGRGGGPAPAFHSLYGDRAGGAAGHTPLSHHAREGAPGLARVTSTGEEAGKAERAERAPPLRSSPSPAVLFTR